MKFLKDRPERNLELIVQEIAVHNKELLSELLFIKMKVRFANRLYMQDLLMINLGVIFKFPIIFQ